GRCARRVHDREALHARPDAAGAGSSVRRRAGRARAHDRRDSRCRSRARRRQEAGPRAGGTRDAPEGAPKPDRGATDQEGLQDRALDDRDQAAGLRHPSEVHRSRRWPRGEGRHRGGRRPHLGHAMTPSRPPHVSPAAVTLRSAEPSDCQRVWALRNDEGVRRASFDSAEIPWVLHEPWFFETLERPDRKLYMILVNGRSEGVARLDIVSAEASVSIYLAPEWQGKGVGTIGLRKLAV